MISEALCSPPEGQEDHKHGEEHGVLHRPELRGSHENTVEKETPDTDKWQDYDPDEVLSGDRSDLFKIG